LFNGQIHAVLSGDDTNEEEILQYIFGQKKKEAAHEEK
jgi:hypothetical protein